MSYDWTLNPRTQRAVRATFAEEASATSENVTGSFQYFETGCPEARLEWTLQVDGSAPRNGTLDKTSRELKISEPITKRPGKATVSVRRADDQLCEVVFRWDKPQFS
jgi:hypothetical protein